MRTIALSPICLYAWLALSASLFGQAGTARLSGTVVDPTGSAIPDATIKLESPEGGAPQTAATGTDGIFLLPSLLPGEYSLTVSATGFTQHVIRALALSPSENLDLKIPLELGEAAFSVEVAASPEGVRVQTTDSQISRIFTMKEIETLPQIDRDPMQLTNFAPGVAINGEFSRVNGTRNSSTNLKYDGILASDPVYPRMGLNVIFSNLDAVAEMRMVLNGGKAEYGRNAGGQIEIVSRRGSNKLSGNLFAYHRNTALNANSFFNNMAGVARPKLILNNFGGSIGGAIVRDRTFYHLNFQGNTQAQEVQRNRTVLTPEARSGLFRWRAPGSQAIQSFDIPRNDPRNKGIDPLMRAKIAQLPEPNNTLIGDGLNTTGYRFNSPANVSVPQGTARVDHSLTSKQRLFARYSDGRFTSLDAFNNLDSPFPGGQSGHQIATTRGFSLGHDWTPTPRIVNELRAGYSGYDVTFESPRSGPVVAPSSFSNTELTAATNGRYVPTWEVGESLSWFRNRHMWKAGINWQRTTQHLTDNGGIYPTYVISRNFGNIPPANIGPSGNTISAADRQRFENLYNDLLGRVANINQTFYSDLRTYLPAGSSRLRDQLFQDWGVYLQDDWRVHRKLMLNIGLRYELFQAPRELNGFMGSVDRPNTLLGATPLTDLAITRRSAYLPADHNNFAPRFGFAYDPFGSGKTSIRGSFGVFYDRGIGGYMQAIDGNTPGFSFAGQSLPNVAGNTDVRLSDGPTLPTPPAAVNTLLPVTRSTGIVTAPDGLRTPYFLHWNFTVQRQIARGTVIEAGYVATRGIKMVVNTDRNQKDLVGSGFISDFVELQGFLRNSAPVSAGNRLVRIFGSPGAAINSLGAANVQFGAAGTAAENLDRAFNNRYAATGLPQTFLRPFPQFSSVNAADSSGRSYYDSLQLSLRRDTGWLRFSANYTFSKNIDMVNGDGGSGADVPIDRFNLRLARGLAGAHIPHSANGTAIVRMPFGRGRRWMQSAPRWLDAAAGGWDLGILAMVQTGFSFHIGSPVDTTGGNGTRANYSGGRIGQVEILPDGARFFTPEQMNLFSIPAAGQFGAISRGMFRLPTQWNTSVSVVKRVTIHDRQALVIRLEGYNPTNSVVFGGLNTNLLIPQTFGRFTSTANSAREVQVALRYEF